MHAYFSRRKADARPVARRVVSCREHCRLRRTAVPPRAAHYGYYPSQLCGVWSSGTLAAALPCHGQALQLSTPPADQDQWWIENGTIARSWTRWAARSWAIRAQPSTTSPVRRANGSSANDSVESTGRQRVRRHPTHATCFSGRRSSAASTGWPPRTHSTQVRRSIDCTQLGIHAADAVIRVARIPRSTASETVTTNAPRRRHSQCTRGSHSRSRA